MLDKPHAAAVAQANPITPLHEHEQKPIPRLLLCAAEAAALCSTSLRTWRAWDAAGKIPQPVRIGRKVFWRPEELRVWVAAGCPDRVTWEAIRES